MYGFRNRLQLYLHHRATCLKTSGHNLGDDNWACEATTSTAVYQKARSQFVNVHMDWWTLQS